MRHGACLPAFLARSSAGHAGVAASSCGLLGGVCHLPVRPIPRVSGRSRCRWRALACSPAQVPLTCSATHLGCPSTVGCRSGVEYIPRLYAAVLGATASPPSLKRGEETRASNAVFHLPANTSLRPSWRDSTTGAMPFPVTQRRGACLRPSDARLAPYLTTTTGGRRVQIAVGMSVSSLGGSAAPLGPGPERLWLLRRG